VVPESDDAEEDCKDYETAELDWFATYGVDCCDRDPVSRNQTGAGEDDIANTKIIKSTLTKKYEMILLIDISSTSISDCAENNRCIQTEAVLKSVQK
jgi:hypothetical protein